MTRGACSVIAVANMKGGVGKTTTVLMLAEGFAAQGLRVLVWDLDAQANASYCFAPDEQLGAILKQRRSTYSFFADHIIYGDKTGIGPYITTRVSQVTRAGEPLAVDLVASGPKLRLLEREIILRLSEMDYGMKALEGKSLRLLEETLADLRQQYDMILFDCAPGISPFTEVAIRLADLVIVPTIPDFLSTLGLDAFRASIWESAHIANSSLPKPSRGPVVLPSRVSTKKRQHRLILEQMRAEAAEANAPFSIYKLAVGDSAFIERAMDPEQFPEPPTFARKWGDAVTQVMGLVSETRRWLDG